MTAEYQHLPLLRPYQKVSFLFSLHHYSAQLLAHTIDLALTASRYIWLFDQLLPQQEH